jgi:hypothetical protein
LIPPGPIANLAALVVTAVSSIYSLDVFICN